MDSCSLLSTNKWVIKISFNVTVYVHNNPEIYKTTWTVVDDGRSYYALYNDYGNTGGSITVDDGNVKFEAEPENGYSFTRWVYRVGSITADVQYSNNNPFTYRGEEDIFIRAEGEEDAGEESWNMEIEESSTALNKKAHYSLELEPYTMIRIKFVCEYSGIVKMYSECDLDTQGFLSTSSLFDTTIGLPDDYIRVDDDSGDGNNFNMSHEVQAGKTYYLWVRFYSPDIAGEVDVYIVPPSASSSTSGRGNSIAYLYITNNGWTHWVKVKPYIYRNEWEPYSPCIYK